MNHGNKWTIPGDPGAESEDEEKVETGGVKSNFSKGGVLFSRPYGSTFS